VYQTIPVRDQSTVSGDVRDMDRNDVAGVNARREEDEAVGGMKLVGLENVAIERIHQAPSEEACLEASNSCISLTSRR
jgi:hypothetical protein